LNSLYDIYDALLSICLRKITTLYIRISNCLKHDNVYSEILEEGKYGNDEVDR
jgi:hypothetical protein